MTIEEARTAFAVIANWRGQTLTDDERAAWKNQLLKMDFDEFNEAIEGWGRGEKSNYRPSLSDLWFLIPGRATHRIPDFTPPPTEPVSDRKTAEEWFAHYRALLRREVTA